MNEMFHAAFYKGTKSGLAGLYNYGVRVVEGGPYSHCEVVFSDGFCASASFMDHGVRFLEPGVVDFDNGKWDLIALPAHLEESSRAWFVEHEGWSYDLRGNVRFLFPYGNRDSKNKAFCCEALLASVGFPNPWRAGVNASADICQYISHSGLHLGAV